MRRALFPQSSGSAGIPVVPAQLADITADPDNATSILDLNGLSSELQSYTRFVTLYALAQGATADTLQIAWRSGAAVKLLSTVEVGFQVIKVLDRFPLRGDAELLVSAAAGETPFVWGYFELEGASNVEVTTRPLLPAGVFLEPFTYNPPIAVFNGPLQDVHLLSAEYFDQLVLDAFVVGTEEDGRIEITDGQAYSIVLLVPASASSYRVFDGIPMKAATNANAPTIKIQTTSAESITVWGSFTRIT